MLDRLARLRQAALDQSRVDGHTHQFYNYPARFSPRFAATAIQQFSSPGGLVLDPFVGGGTTIVEAIANGRRAVGSDLNSLAVFVANAKTTFLTEPQKALVHQWCRETIPHLTYNKILRPTATPCPVRTRNLEGRSTRHLRKIIALALDHLPVDCNPPVDRFLRCSILKTAQWAFDGRLSIPTATQFRLRLQETTEAMLSQLSALRRTVGPFVQDPFIIHDDAVNLFGHLPFRSGELADLVVTSPPYPGVHVLYHRWQIHGRRETPAPFWITASEDGKGASYYTLGGRHRRDDAYFSQLVSVFKSVRTITRTGAFVVQVVGFNDPRHQLPRYLASMTQAGFEEVRALPHARIHRTVPGRRWHAALKGATPASREVILVHQAA